MSTNESQTNEQIFKIIEEDINAKTKEFYKQEFKSSFDYLTDDQVNTCADKMTALYIVLNEEDSEGGDDYEPSEKAQSVYNEFQDYFNQIHEKPNGSGVSIDCNMDSKFDEVDNISERVVEKVQQYCDEQAFKFGEELFDSDGSSVTTEVIIGGFGLEKEIHIQNPDLINRTGVKH